MCSDILSHEHTWTCWLVASTPLHEWGVLLGLEIRYQAQSHRLPWSQYKSPLLMSLMCTQVRRERNNQSHAPFLQRNQTVLHIASSSGDSINFVSWYICTVSHRLGRVNALWTESCSVGMRAQHFRVTKLNHLQRQEPAIGPARLIFGRLFTKADLTRENVCAADIRFR